MAKIRHINNYDPVNGFWGVSVSVWFQGCPHMCYNCFNPETWNKDDYTVTDKNNIEVAKEILIEIDKYYPKTLSILGGDGLAEYNRNDLYEILLYIKNKKPNLKIALWTGYTWNQIKDLEVVKFLDVVVDGRYINKLKTDYKISSDKRDRYRGSTNQIICDVKESLKQNICVEYKL